MGNELRMTIISNNDGLKLAKEFAERSEGGPIDAFYFSTTTDKDGKIVYSILFFKQVKY